MKNFKGKLIAATPFLCLIAYLTIGFVWHIWHPTWLIFFGIILVPIILQFNFFKLLYPIAITAIYIIFSKIYGIWHPLWIIFLTIPVFYIFFESEE